MAEAITIPSPSVFLRASPNPPSPPKSAPEHVRRRSSAAKKAASRKPNAEGAVAKPKQSKSRNGCVTCKAKRLKCGEEKPKCQQCARRNVECGGYKKDFKWRPFEETNVKVNIDRQNRASPPRQRPKALTKSADSSTHDSPQNEEEALSVGHGTKQSDEPVSSVHTAFQQQVFERLGSNESESNTRQDESDRSSKSGRVMVEETEVHDVPIAGPRKHRPLRSYKPVAPSGLGLSPTLTEILMPFSQADTPPVDYVSLDMPDESLLPPPLFDLDPQLQGGCIGEDGVEDVLRDPDMTDDTHIWPFSFTSPSSSKSSGSSEDSLAQWRGPVNYMYQQPTFAPDSAEMLTFRFDKMTCGILSVMDGPNENPWRNLVWPLAQQSPALYHAIHAMTAFHSSTDVPALRVAGHEHKQASLRYIQEGIRDNSMAQQTAIATALALGFSESWDQHTASGNGHIKGAQVLVKQALSRHQVEPLTGVDLSRLKFLCNAWVYMDVIARLTSVDSDESNDFDNLYVLNENTQQPDPCAAGPPGFGIDFGMPIDARLDPLMGCASTLFPLIGRVANLVRKVCRSTTNSPAVITTANDLMVALETWDPPAFIEPPEDPTSHVQHTLQTAEAYRWATLLHLHQSVPELPGMSSAELANRVLTYLATVPLASRTVIVQIYPLMVAGCEASNMEDRQWVRDRWNAMGQRMKIGVIEKCALVTEEVWRRKDEYEAQPTTRRRLVATADLQPARPRGVPLPREHVGDPGRFGMVFSWIDGIDDLGLHLRPGSGGPSERTRMNMPHSLRDNIDPAYTVRGHLHWVGVMWDWNWEVLLG